MVCQYLPVPEGKAISGTAGGACGGAYGGAAGGACAGAASNAAASSQGVVACRRGQVPPYTCKREEGD